jgi:hypothetical protein
VKDAINKNIGNEICLTVEQKKLSKASVIQEKRRVQS